MDEKYDHQKIEQKWQKFWDENQQLFAADEKSDAEKKYILDMFPYPSADGLHAGHVESYTATDIVSRYLRMKGKNVLHPQGWDAFGLPAENFAIKTKTHPSITTQKSIATFKRQMKMLGLSYDWSREIDSSNQEYYKWTQWFFLLFYKNGLAYRGIAKVNWCPSCQTVLANEQAEGGVCERCGTQVVQKDLEQWFFKITDFIEDRPSFAKATDGRRKTSGLISGLDKIDWPEHTKAAQKNWIGKSEGAEFQMGISGIDKKLGVFTTRLDTVFGMTFALIAPEHQLVQELKDKIANWPEVEKYIVETKKKSELQRITEVKEKTGVELEGVKILNPFTKKEMPLFASDFILAHYGTGAVMAVPGHDQRDYEFAKKFNLPIVEVIKSKIGKSSIEKEAFLDDGILINSEDNDGLTSEEARKELTIWLDKNKIGKKTINYKLRDWLISRQRYWGAPIPIIYCDSCGAVPVPEKDLPVLLPDDVDFMPTGESPLARSKKFQDVKCPKCGAKAKRESDTMDTFVCSSWYYFRYADPHNEKEFVAKEKIKKWLPVDLYVGGAEHTVLHLLYSRFFTKVLHNLKLIDFDEPFLKMRHQGIVLAQDGQKMSKSLGNVINPDDVVAQFGADALRMFEMFMGPLEDSKKWDTKGIIGIYRFLERTWNFISKIKNQKSKTQIKNQKLENRIHKTIKKVTEDIEMLKFNTAISSMMILINEFAKEEEIAQEDFETFLKLLSPFAPHIAEEIWQQLGHNKSVFTEKWPQFDKNLVKDETIELVIQINGKVRDKIEVAADIFEEEAKKIALASEKIKTILSGQEPKKVIFVRGRLINIVI
ncbi:MAG: leucine--tRNA ligase [Candidatus Portnoybacteria bacterium CG11_big_fil_rev_8_21_14_0_20_40_15]|uniref:Leucine--tRNA ligase n=1 Tax=Candidatus Portnoybacteria bacterium CG11_big_fil_rev_8_21_14_0_20_40_15 TaxID=1974817 RepID=A0A2H0KVA2_9BACT|nr:MAG: leucine--tRNA ligase [Candidatus Portnoybacteria bacterium CG11_big_fil_rev_8_21_14_0_20_40_15]